MDAPAERVWPWVAHPDGVRTWNEKLVDHTSPPLEELTVGTEFWTTHRMRRDTRVRATITAWSPPTLVEVRSEDGDLGRDGWVVERIEIEPRGAACRVERTVRIHDPRIPWYFRLLASFLMRFGTPKGETNLEALKRRVEAEAAGRDAHDSLGRSGG